MLRIAFLPLFLTNQNLIHRRKEQLTRQKNGAVSVMLNVSGINNSIRKWGKHVATSPSYPASLCECMDLDDDGGCAEVSYECGCGGEGY